MPSNNNYSMQTVQDELYYALFDKLVAATDLSQAPSIIDATYQKFMQSHKLTDYDQKVIKHQVDSFKQLYPAR